MKKKIATEITVKGKKNGEELTIHWKKNKGRGIPMFEPMDNDIYEEQLQHIYTTEEFVIGGTYYIEFGSVDHAMSTAWTFFDEVLKVEANGETMGYEFDPNVIY